MESKRLKELERKVRNLEREVRELKTQNAPVYTEQVKSYNDTVELSEKPKIAAPAEKDSLTKEPVDWEHLIGRVWLPRVFIFVLLLGIVFAFTIVAINGTELIRIVMGFGVAALLIWLGEGQIKKKRDALGKVLVSGSVSLAILTTFTMHVLYDMVPAVIALILNILWVAIGIQLAKKHKSEAVAVLTACLGYLVPFLINGEDSVATMFITYETALYSMLLLFAVRQGYIRLFYAASILWHLVVLLYLATLDWNVDMDLILLTVTFGAIAQHLLIGHFCIQKKAIDVPILRVAFVSFSVTTYWASQGLQFDLMHNERMMLTPLQIFFHTNILYVLYLTIFAVGYGIWAYKGWSTKNLPQAAISLSITTISLALLVNLLIPESVFENTIYLLMGTTAIYLGYQVKSLLQKLTGFFIYLTSALTIFFTEGLDAIFSFQTLAWLFLIVTMLVLYDVIKLNHAANSKLVYAVLGINALVHLVFISHISNVVTEDWSISLQMMTLSFAWALYAVAGAVVGVALNKKRLRMLGMLLLFITLSKLVVIDLQYVSLLIRTVLFIGLGAAGLFVSRLFYVKK